MRENEISISKSTTYLVLFVGIVLSVLISFYTYQQEAKQEKLRFEIATKQITFLIQSRMDAYRQVLLGGAGLFYAADNVTRDVWREYVFAQKIESTFPGIQGLGYSTVVRAAEKESHIEAIRAEGFPNYTIKPEGDRSLYTSIIYLEPFNDRNKRAFGFDMYSEKVRNEAMTRAIESGDAAISYKVRLLQENSIDEQAGFLMYVPIYKKGSLLTTHKERLAAIQGFVYAPFRVKDLMEGVAGGRFDRMDLEIFDGSQTDKKALLFDSHPNIGGVSLGLTSQTKLTICGRDWTLHFGALPAFGEETDGYKHWIALAVGLLFSFALFGVVSYFAKMREMAEAIAKEKTNELLKTTKQLTVSEERLRYALEGAGDGLWDWNIKTNEIYFSKRWKEMLGFAEHEISAFLDEWKNRVYPDDLEKIYADIAAHIDGTNEVYSNEHRIKCKDGSYKWIHARGVIVSKDSDGSPIRMVGAHTDISDRKAAELELESYKESLENKLDDTTQWLSEYEDAIIGYNTLAKTTPELIITNVNDNYANHTKYTKKEMIGRSITDFVDEESLQNLDEIMKIIQSGATYEKVFKGKPKYGEPFFTEAFIKPVKNKNGEIVEYFIIGRDVTQLINTNKKVLEKEKLLVQQSKMAMMGEMIGAIAHQWKQPLNSLGLMIQSIRYAYIDGELDEKYVKEFEKDAMHSVRDMSKTVDDFKNFFSPNKKAEQFFVEDAVSEALKILASQLKAHNIEVRLDTTDANKHQYVCFKNELKQVLLNIFANAKDAILDKNIKNPFIKIDITQNETVLLISIEDSAGGIPEDIIGKVFNSYFTTKEETKGTGIGLYMSKQIVEESLHGKLSVHNTSNGACFEIELPIGL